MASIACSTVAAGGSSPPAACRGAAFGLGITGTFPAPGLWTGTETAPSRQVTLELVPRATLQRLWLGSGWEPLRRLPVGDDGQMLALDEHQEHGYLVDVGGFGSYLITPDGQRVLLAPEPIEPWRWQRLLTAQVLPIAALAQGLELFHASAVAVEGRVLAFTAGSGAGKTTLAARLMLAGATFVSDDVLAVEEVQGDLVAHPGPTLMNLSDSTAESLRAEERAELGTRLGGDEAGPRLLVRRKAASLPLRAIYILRRQAGRRSGVRLSRLSPPSPDLLLGAGFAAAIRPPARLLRRLNLCAQVAARTAVFVIEAPAKGPPQAVAEAVLRHAQRSVP